jgi:protein TonB
MARRAAPRAAPHDAPGNVVLRWGLCFAVIVAAHAGAVLVLLHYMQPPAESGYVAGAAVVMVDLSEMPTAIPTPPKDLPPGPDQAPVEEIPKPKEETKPPEEKVELALPKPEPPKPEQPEPQPPVDATAPPPVMAVPTEAPSTAGVELPQPPSPAVLLRWQSGLSAQLNRVKRYPPGIAARRRKEGTSKIAFRIDDNGQVVEHRLLQSSGWPELDEEALSTPARAQPFPKPPPGTKPEDLWIQWQVTFTVPK